MLYDGAYDNLRVRGYMVKVYKSLTVIERACVKGAPVA
jgi:hypothetical protein